MTDKKDNGKIELKIRALTAIKQLKAAGYTGYGNVLKTRHTKYTDEKMERRLYRVAAGQVIDEDITSDLEQLANELAPGDKENAAA